MAGWSGLRHVQRLRLGKGRGLSTGCSFGRLGLCRRGNPGPCENPATFVPPELRGTASCEKIRELLKSMASRVKVRAEELDRCAQGGKINPTLVICSGRSKGFMDQVLCLGCEGRLSSKVRTLRTFSRFVVAHMPVSFPKHGNCARCIPRGQADSGRGRRNERRSSFEHHRQQRNEASLLAAPLWTPRGGVGVSPLVSAGGTAGKSQPSSGRRGTGALSGSAILSGHTGRRWPGPVAGAMG